MSVSGSWRPPPNWPAPPPGWTPPPGWRPDPRWGPAPEGWRFWDTDDHPAANPVDDPADDMIPGDGVDPAAEPVVLGHRAERRSRKIIPKLAPHLVDGEHVRAFFQANSLRPAIDFIAVTTSRILAGSGMELAAQPLKVSIDAADVTDVRLEPATVSRLPRLVVVLRDRSEVFAGQLMEKNDGPLLGTAVDGLRAAPGPAVGSPRLPVRMTGPGVPEKGVPLEEPAREMLDRAAAAAAEGRIVTEEQLIAGVVALAEQAPMMSRIGVRKWLRALVDEQVGSGRLRRGARRIGTVAPDGLFPTRMEVFTDRIVHGDRAWPIDHLLSASVELDGQVLVSHRPTLTRMALGSVLPGSAIIPGMAFQKKETSDNRKATFVLVHPEWTHVLPVDPESVSALRPLALRINKLAEEMRGPAAAAPPDAVGGDTLARLERVGTMLADGFLSREQAERLRDDILRS